MKKQLQPLHVPGMTHVLDSKVETRRRGILLGVLMGAALLMSQVAYSQTTSGNATTGQTLFNANCTGCHSSATSLYPAVQNGANAGRIFQQALIGGMNGYSDASFTSTQENDIAAYIAQSLSTTVATQSVSHNTSKQITLTNMRMGSTYSNLNGIAIVNGSRGTASYTNAGSGSGPIVTYTPAGGQCGTDSFTVQGTSSTTGRSTNVRTINVTIANPALPVISSGTTGSATFNTLSFGAYTTTTTGGTPNSYGASGLPPGLTINTSTGVVAGTPTAAGTYNATIFAYNCAGGVTTGQNDSQAVTFTIAKASQSITFGAQTTPSRVFSPSGTFTISPLASASSGLSVTYASGNTSVCTVSGSTVTMVGVGTCPIQAQQAGSTNYLAATTVTQNVSITQASQSISFTAQTSPRSFVSIGSSFAISPTATATSGLAVTYSSGNTSICTVSGSTVFMQSAGICPIRANQSGNTNYAAAAQVTQNVTINAIAPTAPQSPGASAGDTQATISFSSPSNTGGAAITGYQVTCSPSGSASGATSPLVVSGLTNNTAYSCSVTATNSAGLTSPASTSVPVTPQATPVAPVITSVASTSFAVFKPGAFQVLASGVPSPTFGVTGTLPSGVTFNAATGQLSGTPASGSVGNYPLTITATNSKGSVNQSFTLQIIKADQAIDFPALADTLMDGVQVTPTATADSGLTVSYSVSAGSAGICSAAGAAINKLGVGTCTVLADQGGNENYVAATQAQRSFLIGQGSQVITFPAQSVTSQPYSGSTTFAINPLATASSGLSITYTSLTTGVCTVSGSTVTKVNVGLCTIQATQAGNANYTAASPESVDVQITQGSQTVSFAASQTAQTFSPGGTFSISPLGTASSGLTVTYSSVTSDVCTVSGTTVTIVSSGVCTVAANQGGNTQYLAAPQVLRNITINPALPGAPGLVSIAAASGQVTLTFDPPALDGGAAITGYTARCTPGPVNAAGAASPINVTGLTNGVNYTCSVAAINAAGTGPYSTTLSATPQAVSGASIWGSICSACHTAKPSGLQLNGAGTTATVLLHVRANVTSMIDTPAVQALSASDLALVAAYINDQVPNIVVTTPPNTAKTVSVASHVTLAGSVAFNAVEVVTPPSNGTLGASWIAGGRSISYTPNPGFTGTDSFTYRPKHTTAGVLGDPRTITIQVTSSTATLTAAGAGTGEGTINSNPFGIYECYVAAGTVLSGVCNNVLFPAGTLITLTANPFPGSAFSGWSGTSCAGGNSNVTCTFTLSTATTVTANFGPPVTATVSLFDLNDDGKSDIVWRNGSTGQNWYWAMTGTTITAQGAITTLATDWQIQSTAVDFDGDGKADILLRNMTTGQPWIWFMNSNTIVGGGALPTLTDLNWIIAGTGDMNGDGKGDVIWRNTATGQNWYWALNGTSIIAQGQITALPVEWAIQSTLGDFNGDGKTDILWRNMTTGQPWVWMMDGTSIIANGPLPTLSDLNWTIAGTGDLNGDGKADVVWRNTATGQNWWWAMDGTTILAQGAITTLTTDWQFQSTAADFDGDGKADILLRNLTTGQPWIWFMNGNAITSGGPLPTLSDLNWQIKIKK